ncbi:tRNA pseudouridine(55) synthase TruB [candidate division WOR-3 bacterium RBG_13_43_14]|uniref:tRNA pseudouridine synthase B n=1 Tax=candidate division WOR-3 bacterium RBG_13_43_14 TaxID=1802590 RepID=A0A1F4U483_UNCW3|nr:MAG: tRNA pseudouridine(55) synthase TruB [candidate division WOR-3 bacterium RBG_13_43_14]
MRHGVIISEEIRLVDKPVGFSSFQLVRLLQRTHDKVGHAGTLDPFASGLIIMMFDRATKEFRHFELCDKEYIGEIMLGMVTDTLDITGQVVTQSNNIPIFSIDEVQKKADSFVGEIDQIPPDYSALKIQGKRSYVLSRQGKKISPVPRRVLVKELIITDLSGRIVRFRTVVGKGVYIRSLANDLGARLGCGGTLISLRRTRIGNYLIDDADDLGTLLMDSEK